MRDLSRNLRDDAGTVIGVLAKMGGGRNIAQLTVQERAANDGSCCYGCHCGSGLRTDELQLGFCRLLHGYTMEGIGSFRCQ